MCRGECLSIRRRLSGFRSAYLRLSEPILSYKHYSAAHWESLCKCELRSQTDRASGLSHMASQDLHTLTALRSAPSR